MRATFPLGLSLAPILIIAAPPPSHQGHERKNYQEKGKGKFSKKNKTDGNRTKRTAETRKRQNVERTFRRNKRKGKSASSHTCCFVDSSKFAVVNGTLYCSHDAPRGGEPDEKTKQRQTYCCLQMKTQPTSIVYIVGF